MVEKSFDQLSLIIPVYREEENIDSLLTELKKYVSKNDEIIFVYDSIDDPTLSVIEQNKLSKEINIRLVQNQLSSGFRAAILTGFKAAQNDWLVVLMADLSDPVQALQEMRQLVIKNPHEDAIVASRYTNKFSGPVQNSIKGWLSYLASASLSFIEFPVSDFTNNFRLYKKYSVEKLNLPFEGGMELAAEILLRLIESNSSFKEVPTTWTDRSKGQSQFRLLQWLPKYFKLYCQALFYCLKKSSSNLFRKTYLSSK